MPSDDFVTFIIPSLGRKTLLRSLDSLRSQTNNRWKAVVVFDNIDPIVESDEKVSVYRYNKPHGHLAGAVRNFALPLVDTEFVAFLDDDDFLHNTYVDRILYWSENYDLIIFSYRDIYTGNIQPPPGLNIIIRCNVGISFAIRNNIVRKNNILFIKDSIEDYYFVNDCVNAGAKWKITHEILYFVGGIGGNQRID